MVNIKSNLIRENEVSFPTRSIQAWKQLKTGMEPELTFHYFQNHLHRNLAAQSTYKKYIYLHIKAISVQRMLALKFQSQMLSTI